MKSVSRVMNNVVPEEHRKSAEKLRELLSTYINSEDLINIGAYKKGSSKQIDEAIRLYPDIISFLKQETNEKASFHDSLNALYELMGKGENIR